MADAGVLLERREHALHGLLVEGPEHERGKPHAPLARTEDVAHTVVLDADERRQPMGLIERVHPHRFPARFTAVAHQAHEVLQATSIT